MRKIYRSLHNKSHYSGSILQPSKIGLTIVGACFCALTVFSQNKLNNWAQFDQYETSNKIVQSLPQKSRNVVFFGNSITEHWIHYDSIFFAKNKFVNRGISGQTTSQMIIRFRKDVLDLKPKVVVILAGTNDIAGNTGYISIDNIAGNIQSMCELAQYHHIKVILCSLLPAFDYPWSRGKNPDQKIPELNALLQKIAQKNNLQYVDLFSRMADEKNGLQSSLTQDGVHPNLNGYKIMEEILLPIIEKKL